MKYVLVVVWGGIISAVLDFDDLNEAIDQGLELGEVHRFDPGKDDMRIFQSPEDYIERFQVWSYPDLDDDEENAQWEFQIAEIVECDLDDMYNPQPGELFKVLTRTIEDESDVYIVKRLSNGEYHEAWAQMLIKHKEESSNV